MSYIVWNGNNKEVARLLENEDNIIIKEEEIPHDSDELIEQDEAVVEDAVPEDETTALKKELQEKQDRLLRLQADFENFRRRTSKEREELSTVIAQGIIKDMLPLLDNFERAMNSEKTNSEAFQKGIAMIFVQFQEILTKNGLEYIEAAGKPFDPNFHQAVLRVDNPEVE